MKVSLRKKKRNRRALLPYSHGYGSAPLPRGPRMVCGSHAISFKNNKNVSETDILSEQLLPPQNITGNITYITGWWYIYLRNTICSSLSLSLSWFPLSIPNTSQWSIEESLNGTVATTPPQSGDSSVNLPLSLHLLSISRAPLSQIWHRPMSINKLLAEE
jgi:hypothetical protein